MHGKTTLKILDEDGKSMRFNFVLSGIKFLIGPRELLGALQSFTAQNGDRVGKAEVCFDS
jgi:hypothetical protein